jgi:hypothetical protein
MPRTVYYLVAAPQGLDRTGVMIDVETIGLDPDYSISNLAVQRIRANKS